ncbi:RING zinc finger protein-like [Iris pallida]|uniref:RING zinc finger protein-like n=1 Tax=Iris pallida TaxID=29817 RepID=A0AAX6GLC6_IRIPA|nr:RING zinc finger protein-like [Iris pallida]
MASHTHWSASSVHICVYVYINWASLAERANPSSSLSRAGAESRSSNRNGIPHGLHGAPLPQAHPPAGLPARPRPPPHLVGVRQGRAGGLGRLGQALAVGGAAASAAVLVLPSGLPVGVVPPHRGDPPGGAVQGAGCGGGGGGGGGELRGVPVRAGGRRRGAAAEQLQARLPQGVPRPVDGPRPAHLPPLPHPAHPRRDAGRLQ